MAFVAGACAVPLPRPTARHDRLMGSRVREWDSTGFLAQLVRVRPVGAMFGAAPDHAAGTAADRRAEERAADAAAEQRGADTAGDRADRDPLVTGVALVAAALGVGPAVIIMAGIGGGRGERRGGNGESEQKAHGVGPWLAKVVTHKTRIVVMVP